jgi:hypothetical protein
MKYYSQTRCTRAATLLSTVLQNHEAITTVFFKAKQKVIDMDFYNTFFEAAMDVSTWDEIAEWEPALRYIAVMTNTCSRTPPPVWRPCVLLIPRNCRGVVFGPRAGSVDDYIIFEEALRKHILARPCACILFGPFLPRLPRCISDLIHQDLCRK